MSFLQLLDKNMLDSIILEFEAISLHNRSSSSPILQDASSICSSVMQTVHKDPYSLQTAVAVDSLWKKVDTINDAHNLSKIITYTTRALIMVTTWTMFDWVTRIVNHAISHPETPSWVASLVTNIRAAIQAHHADNAAATNHPPPNLKSRAKASLHLVYLSNIP